jgi:uncharacterized protein YecE (DUF72 family)
MVRSRAMTSSKEAQGTLFELAPYQLEAAAVNPEHARLRAALPSSIRFGAMTWTFPGWRGIVYGASASEKQLAQHGLSAYAKHPLLRSVEIDRTYYEPLSAAVFRSFADQAPEDFRFFVKAHEDCTVLRFPPHARYGKKRGANNPRFLDAAYAERAVIAPLVEGLGRKLGGLLFQFPPQQAGEPRAFAGALHDFLRRLPSGPTYAVELRNAELLTQDYGAALADAGAIHCHNLWGAMPSILAQARRIPPAARRPLLIRWLLRPNHGFEETRARFAPFNRIVSEDRDAREAIASLVARAHAHAVPAFVFVDNKAEGCAPESIARLGQSITAALTPKA